jgi:hypothetical protein
MTEFFGSHGTNVRGALTSAISGMCEEEEKEKDFVCLFWEVNAGQK